VRPPILQGDIDRRLLVNYRVEPAVLEPVLPPPFRPQLIGGWAVAGICLIRLSRLRPRWTPVVLGRRSENAAHRVAVEWDTPDGVARGVYIPRRDTSSVLNVVAGGRLFPGEHHRARFTTEEHDDHLRVAFESVDGSVAVDVSVDVVPHLESTLFTDLATASAFFRSGSVGYSTTTGGPRLDGLELRTDAWRLEAAAVTAARSSFFDDPERFPSGSVALDSALLMRGVPVTWHPVPARPSAPPLQARQPAPLLRRAAAR
jgi:hypothetical protein